MWCIKCDYELHATPDGPCPECGRVFTRADSRTYRVRDDFRHDRRVYSTATCLAASPLAVPVLLLVPGRLWPDAVVLGGITTPCFALVGVGFCLFPEIRKVPGRARVILGTAVAAMIVWFMAVAFIAS